MEGWRRLQYVLDLMDGADDHKLILDVGANLLEVPSKLKLGVRVQSLGVAKDTLGRVDEFELVGQR